MYVLSHVQIRHVTHLNELCHTYAWDVLQIWMSHVTFVDKSWHDYVVKTLQNMRIRSQKRICHISHVNESWHTYEWVMAHIWMSHGTHMNESLHTYESVMARTRMGHGNESCHILMSHANMNESCLIWMSHVTYACHVSYEWVMSHTNVSCQCGRVTCQWVMSLWMSHVLHTWWMSGIYVMSHMKDSCHISKSHVKVDESCHILLSPANMNESRVVSLIYVTYICFVSYEWFMSHTNATWGMAHV